MFNLWYLSALLSLSTSFREVEAADKCTSLKNAFKFANTTILDSKRVSPGANFSVPGSCQSTAVAGEVSICRVQVLVNTTDTSRVHFEAWLPDEWFGRFLGLGNGGLGGCIDYTNLAYGSSFHFATVSSDNGHDGDSGSALLNQPEVINDFAFRAVHVEVEVGKALVQSYYGRKHHKAYYLGCSTGGRQGLKEAEMFPTDFDGIVAGSPATDFNHLNDWQAFLGVYVGAPNPNSSASFIQPELWPLISQEILSQCDALDGVEDGIITEPDDCQFRPEALVCTSHNTSTCLTPAQIDALHKIYQPLFGSAGELLFTRYDPGAEGNGEFTNMFSGSIFSISDNWFKFAIFNDTNHDFSNFNLSDVALADSINPGGIATWTGDLSAFHSQGGKLITYHGRKDQLISSDNSKRMYNLISETMALPSLDPFYRLFLIPGMEHCSGGPGAWAIGQSGLTSSIVNSSSHNVLLAIVDWVENGLAPAQIVGSVTGNSTASRIHCRYPERSVWNGRDWTCVA